MIEVNEKARIFHAFNWRLNDVKKNIHLIKEQEFNYVQINPIQPLKEDNFNIWWLSYQPCGFDIGNNYGNINDLQNLCEISRNYGIGIIVDCICNHTAGANDGSLNPHEKVDSKLLNNPYLWKPKQNIQNWNDRFDVTHNCMGLPGLNPQNYDLQNIIITFLNELINCGVSGFRFDAAKNIALPDEGCDFWPRVLGSLNKKELFLYGEVIFELPLIAQKYSQYFKILTNENYPLENDKLVKFVESHDSYYEFKYTNNISSSLISEYYYGLTKEYINTLYFVRPYDDTWKSNIIKEANKQKVYKK